MLAYILEYRLSIHEGMLECVLVLQLRWTMCCVLDNEFYKYHSWAQNKKEQKR